MKKINKGKQFPVVLVLTLGLFLIQPTTAGVSNGISGCKYKGIKLYGKVKLVDSFPDIKVKVVSSFPDLKVQKVSSFANSCGQWKFVDSFPDFKVKFVDFFPDFKIKFVSSFPGEN